MQKCPDCNRWPSEAHEVIEVAGLRDPGSSAPPRLNAPFHLSLAAGWGRALGRSRSGRRLVHNATVQLEEVSTETRCLRYCWMPVSSVVAPASKADPTTALDNFGGLALIVFAGRFVCCTLQLRNGRSEEYKQTREAGNLNLEI